MDLPLWRDYHWKMVLFQESYSFGPQQAVIWRFDRENIKPAHFHGQVELLIVRKGQARLQLGTREYDLSQGDVAWILPPRTHVMSGFSDDFDMWIIISRNECQSICTCYGAG